jgi:hypothetical protein
MSRINSLIFWLEERELKQDADTKARGKSFASPKPI